MDWRQRARQSFRFPLCVGGAFSLVALGIGWQQTRRIGLVVANNGAALLCIREGRNTFQRGGVGKNTCLNLNKYSYTISFFIKGYFAGVLMSVRTNLHATRRTVLLSAAAVAFPTWTEAAESWPTKPIKMVHAFAPGSVTDNAGRMIAERLSQTIGQPVVVENRPGANMIIGTEWAAKQPADGHVMTIGTCDNMAINPNLYRNPGYRSEDFDPVTLIGMLPLAVMVPGNSRFNTFAEMKAEFTRTRKPLTFGTWGVGSFAHMVGEMIRMETGVNFEYVPFQGATPALNTLLGGHIDATLVSSGTGADHVLAKRLKALAVGAPTRFTTLSDVPTFTELGYPTVRAAQWHGVFVRAGGNKEIVEKIYLEVAKLLNDPKAKETLLKAGYARIDGRTPVEFAKFINEEVDVWGRVIKASGVTAER